MRRRSPRRGDHRQPSRAVGLCRGLRRRATAPRGRDVRARRPPTGRCAASRSPQGAGDPGRRRSSPYPRREGPMPPLIFRRATFCRPATAELPPSSRPSGKAVLVDRTLRGLASTARAARGDLGVPRGRLVEVSGEARRRRLLLPGICRPRLTSAAPAQAGGRALGIRSAARPRAVRWSRRAGGVETIQVKGAGSARSRGSRGTCTGVQDGKKIKRPTGATPSRRRRERVGKWPADLGRVTRAAGLPRRAFPGPCGSQENGATRLPPSFSQWRGSR
jgi:hypothetical protein